MRATPRGITVLHKEYLMDIKPSDQFFVRSLQLNPGLSTTFPWLSQITDAYEQYRFKGLVFEYKATSSLFTPGAQTSALGSVIMACNYNANSPPFQSKREMENYVGANSSTPTSNMAMAVNVANPITDLAYIRLGQPTEENYDLRLYDIGTFQLATQGNQISTTPGVQPGSIGELWVTYELELFKPKYRTSGTKMDRYQISKLQTLCNYGDEVVTASRPFTTLPEVSAFTPGVPGGNGYFSVGTKIISVGVASNANTVPDQEANYNALVFPTSSLGKTYRIDIVSKTFNGTDSLSNAAMDSISVFAVQNMDLVSYQKGVITGTSFAPRRNTDCTVVAQPFFNWAAIVKCKTDVSVEPQLTFRYIDATPWPSWVNTAIDCFHTITVTEVPFEGYERS